MRLRNIASPQLTVLPQCNKLRGRKCGQIRPLPSKFFFRIYLVLEMADNRRKYTYTMQIRLTPEEKDWLMEAGPEKSDERRDLHTPR